MLRFIALASFLAVAVIATEEVVPEPANRFLALATTRTSTSVVLSTTTLPTTVARTCYTTTAAVAQCRRRRGIEEVPEIVNPDHLALDIQASKPIIVKVTEAPQAFEVAKPEADIQSSSEVEVSGLDSCLGRSAFGITIFYTTTTTVSLTSYSTTLSGSSTFTVLGCTPANFPYSAC